MNKFAIRCLAPAVAAWVFGVQLAYAAAWPDNQYSRVRVVSEVTAVGHGEPFLLGVEIVTRPGWKTYWRAAGEVGLPPHFAWVQVENAAPPDIMWPVPQRFMSQGSESYGYTGGVIFPFLLQPLDAANPVSVQLRVQYAVCLDICVPEQADLGIVLEPGEARATAVAASLHAAAARVPTAQGEKAFPRIIEARIQPGNKGAVLMVSAISDQPFQQPDLFVDGAPDFLFSAPEISFAENRRSAQFAVRVQPLDPDLRLAGQEITLTLADGDQATEHTVHLAH